ncbi:hypothetical protein ABZZ78_35630, partial [Streptomyces sp. NPDC006415]
PHPQRERHPLGRTTSQNRSLTNPVNLCGHSTSNVIGGYMLFYSLGSAVGATGTTAVYSVAGWAGSSLLGAAFALCALLVWALNRHAAADTRRDVLV